VGPTFTRWQFYRAIGIASISNQIVNMQSAPGFYQVNVISVEADWDDDESDRVEVRVEIFLSANAWISNVNISQVRYWVTILAQV
jgi:hypothetical protein